MHTPGPWTYYGNDIEAEYIRSPRGRNGTGWNIVLEGAEASEMPDNVRLIAASPELLEALSDILSQGEGFMTRLVGFESLDKARAAIAKATGG